MELIAASRIARARRAVEQARPYAQGITQVIRDLATVADLGDHPLLKRRDQVETVGVIVITSDRGLAGAYNSNVLRRAERAMTALARRRPDQRLLRPFLGVGLLGGYTTFSASVVEVLLARPAVEAGEKLGFLPGDLVEKVNPYLRPLYDALYDIIGYEKVGRMIERGIIEVAPIAFMRGRTLNDSFVILDEAQNTTPEQMKMFLTRIGFHSKAVVNGDITQVDLPPGARSGLRVTREVLGGIEGIEFFTFDQRDVVRHPLVQKIVTAYDRWEQMQEKQEATERAKESSEGEPTVRDAGRERGSMP